MLCERLRKETPSTVLPALHLAGDEETDYVGSMCDALRSYDVLDRTTFFRYIRTSAAMREFYQRLDLYVILSTREGLSVAMLEALACGCPSTILSPWGDDVIEDGLTGFRLSSPRPEDVANRMYGVMLDRDGLRQVGQRGAAHVHTHFSQSSAARKLVEFYTLAIAPAS
jgi:glycosyltransferase involved in cell wall biosynthesis